jgi:hypothetical protein
MIHRFTRRDAMRLSAGALLSAGLWPGALAAEGDKDSGDFYFIAVNDMHWKDEKGADWFARLAKQMKGHAEQPDFVLLVGDLAEDGTPEQLGPMRDWCKDLGLPVRIVPGNHDYVTQTDRKPYDDLFPGRLNFHFEHRGWQFVGFDSTDGQKAKGVSVLPPTLQWLDATLPKLDKKKPMIAFTHFPLGGLIPYRAVNADAVLERFKPFNVRAVYNGHFHGFTERVIGEIVLTTNKCCSFARANHDGTKEKGYFLCRAKDGKVTRTFVEVKPA